MTTEEQFKLMEKYKPGTTVIFRDANATVSDGVDGLREGIVTNAIWFADDPEFGDAYADKGTEPVVLPVWAERDKGREPTNILVRWENVIGISAEAE